MRSRLRNRSCVHDITHDFLSMMLGVRRPGVTLALQALEGGGLIWVGRGRITVLDRTKLEEVADDAYGPAEAEYARVMAGASWRAPLLSEPALPRPPVRRHGMGKANTIPHTAPRSRSFTPSIRGPSNRVYHRG